MKEKTNFIFGLLKSALLGVIVSVLLTLVFAFVLKFIELGDGVISVINEIIKIISILIAGVSLIKHYPHKAILKTALVGVVYTVLTFILFSALRGSYNFGFGLLVDLILGAVIGAIVAVIINLFSRERA